MKPLTIALVAVTAISLAGCYVHRERVVDDRDADRAWWEGHHAGEQFERERATNEHRAWCVEHTGDSSCAP